MSAQNVEQELVELEKQFWQAMKDRDAETAAQLTNEACLLTGPQGVARIERAQLAEMIRTADYILNDFRFGDDVQVQLLDQDVAVLAYDVHEDLTVNGSPIALDASESSTWIRRDGRWLCAQHSEAIHGDPFGRDRQPHAH